ncbi:MAG: DUF1553 domain-containing protein, partial [Verrucomicrobiota bacterium]|nr:DUF1553 domain-containing protein [Verrucomicrobiota bacterium]
RGWDLWVGDRKPGIHLIHKWPDDSLKVISKRQIEVDKWTHVFVTYDGSSKAEGIQVYINGERTEVDLQQKNLSNSTRTETPLKIGQRKNGDNLEKAAVQDVRIYSRLLKEDEIKRLKEKPRIAWIVSKEESARSDKDKQDLYDFYLTGFDLEYKTAAAGLAALEQEEREIKDRGTIAHVMNEKKEPASAYILFRGEYDKRRDKVDPATPKVLPAFPEDFPRNRLGFAKWLLLPENPLTTRVTVNRIWQELFGNGFVRTSGDFGITGELPSHPELLDWLAVDFRESAWDIKRLYKMIVLSSTYRQASEFTPEKLAKDPENRLLSRGPRYRMEAEMIRDMALAASGLLVPKIGGPSVKPYQPEGVWEMVAMPGSDTRDYKQDKGENLYRRSLYTFWKRTAPPPNMDIFNAPTRETCTVRRERTNTPLQALATMNDTQFVEAARHLAEKALLEKKRTPKERLDFMAERLIARPLEGKERKIVENSLAEIRQHYLTAPEDAKALITVGESKPNSDLNPVELASYTMIASQLMNLDEALNK